jgi:tight adherence protein B
VYLVAIAVALGVLSWIVLVLLDRRKRKPQNIRIEKISRPDAVYLVEYDEYHLSGKERWAAILMLAIPMVIVGYIFYKSIVIALILSSVGLLYPKFRRQHLIRIRKNKLNVQFKQALSCLSSALSAGKSVETAFQEALEDLRVLYPDPTCFIVSEFGIICRRLENGEPIEAAILDFSKRANLEDATSFADVFVTCKRTGGNLVEVMKRTSAMIGEKLEIKQDISVMIAQKKFESRVLLLAPIFIVAILSFSSPEYMEPLYKGIGFVIMTVCLALLLGCYYFTQKIMNIKV